MSTSLKSIVPRVLLAIAAIGLAGCFPDLGAALDAGAPGKDAGSTGGGAGGGGGVGGVGGGVATGGGAGGSGGGAPDAGVDLVAKGEVIFFTIEGTGCAGCHGQDGRGDQGPNIRGKSREAIVTCLQQTPEMAHLVMTEEEIDAITAYLLWLKGQP